MGSIHTNCPKCTKPNEVNTDYLPLGLTAISCWNCATAMELPEKSIVAARKAPTSQQQNAPPLIADNPPDPAAQRRLVILVGAVGGAILLLLIIFVAVALLTPSEGPRDTGSQFRAAYHRGEKAPSGDEAWTAKIAVDSGFAPASTGELIVVSANDSILHEAADFSPIGVPDDITPRFQKLHQKMAVMGFTIDGEIQKTALASGQSQRFRIQLDKSTCYHIAGFGGKGARQLEMHLYEPYSKRPTAADLRGSSDSFIEYCSEQRGEFEIDVRMKMGGGFVNFVVYKQSETVLHERGHVYAVKSKTGEIEWQSTLEDQVSTAPAASLKHVVVGTRTKIRSKATGVILIGGAVRVLLVEDGSSHCFHEAEGPVLSAPTLHEGVVYTGSCGQPPEDSGEEICREGSPINSRFFAVSANDCSLIWSFTAPHPVLNSSVTDGARVYFSTGNRLYAIDSETGAEVWHHDAQGRLGSPVVHDEMVVVGAADRTVRALDAEDGDRLWFFQADDVMTATPAIHQNLVHVGSADGTLYAIDPDDGERLWDASAPGALVNPISATAGLVFVLTSDRLTAFNHDTGTTNFQVPIEDAINSRVAPVVVNGTVVFPNQAGTLYGFR